MGHAGEIYGLDIETDTRHDGADPAVAAVRTIALSCRRLDEVFTGDEATLLADLNDRLASLPPGILATWNGATFDLPFIADRARLLGVDLDLRLCLDRRLTLGRTPLPGHAGAYRGAWGHHGHVDTFRLYGLSSASPVWTSLRTIGQATFHTLTPSAANSINHATLANPKRRALPDSFSAACAQTPASNPEFTSLTHPAAKIDPFGTGSL